MVHAEVKVALEAICGERTISELATTHQIHPNQITHWKWRPSTSWPRFEVSEAAESGVISALPGREPTGMLLSGRRGGVDRTTIAG